MTFTGVHKVNEKGLECEILDDSQPLKTPIGCIEFSMYSKRGWLDKLLPGSSAR